jgi:hypothetical protein
MKTIKKTIVILVSIFFLVSCEKDIEFSGKITDPLLVINCIVSPDSVISAQISKSKFFLADDSNFDNIENAEVSVFINGAFKGKMTYISNGLYQSSIIPNAGDIISLKASATGVQSASCQTIVTPKPDVISVDTIIEQFSSYPTVSYKIDNSGSYDTTGFYVNFQIKFKIKIHDGIKYQNYYRIVAQIPPSGEEYEHNYIYITLDGVLSGNQNDPTSLIGASGENMYNIFSDELFNGKDFNVVFTVSGSGYIKLADSETQFLNIHLQNMNSDYYKYLYTRGQALFSDGFFSEPVQIYNNVVGGIGIMGAYNNDNNYAKINLLDLYKKAKTNGNAGQSYNSKPNNQ